MHAARKVDLRRELLDARAARSAAELDAARAAIRDLVLARCEAAGWRCVAAYVPMRTEPGSVELLDALAARGVRVLAPVLLADRELDWAEWDPARHDLAEDRLGLDAIGTADAVLAPALAVGPDGMRLGRGGGSYDRALARIGRGVPVIALLFDGETGVDVPAEAWDRPVTAAVTPSGWADVAR